MIPLIHQGLHILALGQRSHAEDMPDAPGFIAALAAQDASPNPPATAVSAEACLVAGMVVPAQPILKTEPVPENQPILAAEPVLTAPAISPAAPTPAHPAEANTSELAAAAIAPPTMPLSTALPLVLTPEHHPQPAAFAAMEIPAVSALKSKLPLAADESSHSITLPEKLRTTVLAETIAPPLNTSAPIPIPMPPPQRSSTIMHGSITAPTPIIAKTNVPTTALAPQISAVEISTPAQTVVPPTDQPTTVSNPVIPPLPRRIEASAPQAQTFLDQTLPVQTLPDRIPGGQTQDAPPSALPEQNSASLSPAESAWQTRLQAAVLGAQPNPTVAPLDRMRDATPPTADSPNSATPSRVPDDIDFKPFTPPISRAHVAPSAITPSAQVTDRATPQAPGVEIPPPQQHPTPTTAPLSSDMPPKPPADAAHLRNPVATPPDQATLPAPDHAVPPLTNPASPPPIPPHQTVQMQILPPSLPATVPAQLIHHAAAAKTGGVDVLLQPEELGHVKFQIQQHGDTVRILLSAERPETLDLLRRHSDQLLQEFRQSGFSQASLNFGQWGQQQRSPPPPPVLVALFDADFTEAPPPQRPPPAASATSSGQGLNLRL
ncbi:MAG: flagellar hook-length control protein FliK [Pseudomonadota bacterium]